MTLIKSKIKIEDVFLKYTLTNEQSGLVKKLDYFLDNNKDKIFLLKGYAGTGKTFITKGLTEYFRAIGRNYILAAPTGKAAKVISSKTRSEAYTIHKTIYSFKDIAEYLDDNINGTETYKFYSRLAVNQCSVDTVYIIDEASMVSDIYQETEFFRFGSGFLLKDLLKFINLDHNDHSKKIIFIGDNAQLPPVGMKSSPALDPEYLLNKYALNSSSYELTEVVRQKSESGVMHNSILLRKTLSSKVFNQLDIDLNFSDLEHIEYSDLISSYLNSCNNKINGESIIIAHSNADVTTYNKRIRKYFFPGMQKITSGDKMIAVTNNDAHGFFISNGDFGLVRQVLSTTEMRNITLQRKSSKTNLVDKIHITLQFKDIEVGFRDLDGTAKFFKAKVIENLLYSESSTLSSDEHKALYLDFCIRNKDLKRNSDEFKKTLRSDPYFNALRLKFGYAITCHKAQGSEWNNVFVKCNTHQNKLSESYFRWLYTAITRTTRQLYLLDEPHIKLGSGIKSVQPPIISNNHINQITNKSLKIPATEDKPQTNKTFGIPLDSNFLLSLLNTVRNILHNTEIIILDIQHQQYQEAYWFQQGDKTTRVNIYYNSKQKVSTITTPQSTAFSNTIVSLLIPLQGKLIICTRLKEEKDFQFNELFLQQFHQLLSELCKAQNIGISDVNNQQWFQRYSFLKSGESAVFDIYYNGKHQFTKYSPLRNACTSQILISQISDIITKGLS